MAPSSKLNFNKPRKPIKMTPGEAVKLDKALDDIEAFYGDILASWHLLTPQQKADTLAHSPILKSLKELTDPLRG